MIFDTEHRLHESAEPGAYPAHEVAQLPDGRLIRPAHPHIVFVRKRKAGGVLPRSDFYVEHHDDLPAVYGVVVAVRDDCRASVKNDPHGVQPGDLIYYHRYATEPVAEIRVPLELQTEGGIETAAMTDTLLALHADEVACRVDGVLKPA